MTDEWQARELDLPTCLARIDYHGPLHPTARTLANLHRAHVAAIPFENLDVLLGRARTMCLCKRPQVIPCPVTTTACGCSRYNCPGGTGGVRTPRAPSAARDGGNL